MPSPLVAAVNTLTAHWLAAAGSRASAVSGLGVWPLLALIAEPSAGPGRAELAAAIGVAPEDSMAHARAVLDLVEASPAAAMACGLWTRADLELNPEWAKRLPPGTRGSITGRPEADAPVLDAWAAEHTRGRIEHFPLQTTDDTRLILATALAVETTWEQPFTDTVMTIAAGGPWPEGVVAALSRLSYELDAVRIVPTSQGSFTDVTVAGDRGVDVHLVLGPADAAPGDVLASGVIAIEPSSAADAAVGAGDAASVFTADDPNPGPGISVARVPSHRQADELFLSTVPFDLSAAHDLLEYADVLGLRSVSDLDHGHFPGMSEEQLGVGAAAQDILARFSAKGFEAAAVTALGVFAAAAMPMQTFEVTRVSVVFDRPFAYYAVDRGSGLILVAGWVGAPAAAEPELTGRAR